ncbi:MAG: hypothetical protein J6N95_02510 [Bacilli bacterium]|nr:hypothetical protein [Bacilli bacterium]
MSETRLEKYKKYRQSINEFKSISNEPESVQYREKSVVNDKMNTSSTLPLDEVLGKVDEQQEKQPKRVITRKLVMIICLSLIGVALIAGITIFAIFAFGGK